MQVRKQTVTHPVFNSNSSSPHKIHKNKSIWPASRAPDSASSSEHQQIIHTCLSSDARTFFPSFHLFFLSQPGRNNQRRQPGVWKQKAAEPTFPCSSQKTGGLEGCHGPAFPGPGKESSCSQLLSVQPWVSCSTSGSFLAIHPACPPCARPWAKCWDIPVSPWRGGLDRQLN